MYLLCPGQRISRKWQETKTCIGQEQTQGASQHGQQDTLSEELLNQPFAVNTKSKADCYFLLPPGGTREQKTSHIHAGHEQNKANTHQQYEQCRPHISNNGFLQWLNISTYAFIFGELLGNPKHDGVQVGHRLFPGDIRLQLPCHIKEISLVRVPDVLSRP